MPSRLPQDLPALPAPVVSIVGDSNSGKTELICRLLAWWQARGRRVAVLKHTHKRILGDEAKDTGRYRRAGAGLVALAAPGWLQTTRAMPGEPPLAQVLAELGAEADLILVEGYKYGPLPKVAVLGPGAPGRAPDYPEVIALVSAAPVATSAPVFEPQQIEELGRFLERFLGLE